MTRKTDRRCFLVRGIVGTAVAGAAYSSIEEDILLAAIDEGRVQPSPADRPRLEISADAMPCGKIGGVSLSRLILGGNLMAGYAHSRDLTYMSKLFTSYNTEAKILETFELAQACGITMVTYLLTDIRQQKLIDKFNTGRTTKLQTLVVFPLRKDKAAMGEIAKRLADSGATLAHLQGNESDRHFMEGGQADEVAQAVDLVKAQGIPTGIACHALKVVKICEQDRVNADFYVKTFHSDRNPSEKEQP